MIETVSELLAALKAKGMDKIEPFEKIPHAPTIGMMYEGLTKQIMEKAIFQSLNLSVVSGFIENNIGDRSRQIDCMIVMGEGTRIPNTTEFIYPFHQVIMVIEVKKNLFTSELDDAYNKLEKVYEIGNPLDNPEIKMNLNMVQEAFATISKTPLPEDIQTLDLPKQMLYHTLVVENYLPLRVVFGYGGFSSEKSLRDKFCDYMCKSTGKKNRIDKIFGMTRIPNLIICGENSLVKTNGMPYAAFPQLLNNHKKKQQHKNKQGANAGLIAEDEYCWLASYRCKPLLVLLEVLWCRLSWQFNLQPYSFDDYFRMENLAPLFLVRFKKSNCYYRFFKYTDMALAKLDNSNALQAAAVSATENALLLELAEKGYIIIDRDLKRFVEGKGENLEDILSHLTNERLIYVKDNIIKLLTDTPRCLVI